MFAGIYFGEAFFAQDAFFAGSTLNRPTIVEVLSGSTLGIIEQRTETVQVLSQPAGCQIISRTVILQ